jgi:hypothetical protein
MKGNALQKEQIRRDKKRREIRYRTDKIQEGKMKSLKKTVDDS